MDKRCGVFGGLLCPALQAAGKHFYDKPVCVQVTHDGAGEFKTRFPGGRKKIMTF